MKIAAIAKVIKDRASCHIVRIHGAEDTETSMFIGTSCELYSLEGFPKPWTEAEIMTMLGIQKKQWDDVIYREYLCDTEADEGTPDQMFSTEYGARVEITMNGKRYTTNWGNVVMVEE